MYVDMVQVATVVRQTSSLTSPVSLGKIVDTTKNVVGTKVLQIQVYGKKTLDMWIWAVSSILVAGCSMEVVVVVIGTAYACPVDDAPSRSNSDQTKAGHLVQFARSDLNRPCPKKLGRKSARRADEWAGGGEISKWMDPPSG